MTKLEKMLAELCPNGVEVREIGEFAKVEKNRNKERKCDLAYSITKGGLIPTGEYFKDAKITSDDTSGYRIVKKNWFVYSPSRIDVGSINYLRNDIEVIVSPLNVVFSVDEAVILPSYLLYFLSSRSGTWQIITSREGIEGTGRKLLPFDKFAKIKVPVPPIEVQKEIVKALDVFTEYNYALESELTARKKQYEYYRDELLSFNGGECEWRTIKDACIVKAGGDVPKDDFSKEKTDRYSVPIISNGIGENALYGFTSIGKILEPAVTVAARGTIGYAEYRDYPYYPIIRLLSVIPLNNEHLNTKYLYYILQKQQYEVPKTGIPQLTSPMIQKVQIPIPPIQEQERIVSILDRFDKLCNDISEGLPAEIEARRKQYEYYRDKLLTFPPKG